MFALPEQKLQELLTLLAILGTQGRISHKELEILVGNLRSMHLAFPGVVAHLYHIYLALEQGEGVQGLSPSSLLPINLVLISLAV